ncbi:MAG: hypothetical protein WA954_05980 [Parerythrobacter sp.]
MRIPDRTPKFLLLAVAAACLPVSAPAQDRAALTLQQQTAVRCSAAFAIVADAQARGRADASAYPALAERGQEFFVRTAAQLMDDRGLSREQVADLIQTQAQALWDENAIEAVMPGCLLLLDASGL